MNSSGVFCVLVALTATLGSFAPQAEQAGETGGTADAGNKYANVSLNPRISHVVSGETCTLQIIVNTADSMSCMESVISFDTSLVALTSVDEGGLFDEAPFFTFFEWGYVSPDTISVVDCVMGYRSFILPPGELVSFVFEAKQSGVCPVRISKMKLWGIDRIEVLTTVDPSAWIIVDSPTGVATSRQNITDFKNYPNPFNPVTTITFSLPAPFKTNLSIFTPGGRLVKTLVDELLVEGRQAKVWNGTDSCGNSVGSGIYFCRLQFGKTTLTNKVVLLR